MISTGCRKRSLMVRVPADSRTDAVCRPMVRVSRTAYLRPGYGGRLVRARGFAVASPVPRRDMTAREPPFGSGLSGLDELGHEGGSAWACGAVREGLVPGDAESTDGLDQRLGAEGVGQSEVALESALGRE
jgi:hypothetical protein